jgi:hypothetical protein
MKDDKWTGKFELDHCNGRSGNSFIGEELKEMCRNAAHEWIEEDSQ